MVIIRSRYGSKTSKARKKYTLNIEDEKYKLCYCQYNPSDMSDARFEIYFAEKMMRYRFGNIIYKFHCNNN